MRKFLHISSKLSYMLICVQEWYWQLPYIWTQCFDGSSYSSARSVYAWACTVKIIVRLLYPYFGNFSCISFVCVTRGGVISSAGPAKAGPCTFQQVVGLVPRLHQHPCVAKYTSPCCRSPPHARVIFYLQWPNHFWNAGAASFKECLQFEHCVVEKLPSFVKLVSPFKLSVVALMQSSAAFSWHRSAALVLTAL